MLEMGEPEYPPEVRAMLSKLGRDKARLKLELTSITSLEARILADYGPPPLNLISAPEEIPRSRGGSRAPRPECPLSDDEIRKVADPAAILEAFARALPDASIYPTASARWITGARLVSRDSRSYRVTLRRLMENNPDIWRKESDGGFTHIPTRERSQAPEDHGSESPDQENQPLQEPEQGHHFDDSLP